MHMYKMQWSVPTLGILCASPTSKWIEFGNLWPGQHSFLLAGHMAGNSEQWHIAHFHMANELRMAFVILKGWGKNET